MFNVRHVVFDRREGLRWFFVDTETKKEYLLSLILYAIKTDLSIKYIPLQEFTKAIIVKISIMCKIH